MGSPVESAVLKGGDDAGEIGEFGEAAAIDGGEDLPALPVSEELTEDDRTTWQLFVARTSVDIRVWVLAGMAMGVR